MHLPKWSAGKWFTVAYVVGGPLAIWLVAQSAASGNCSDVSDRAACMADSGTMVFGTVFAILLMAWLLGLLLIGVIAAAVAAWRSTRSAAPQSR